MSLLPQFTKILEQIFDLRLDNFIELNEILNESQYGVKKTDQLPWPCWS